MKWFKQWLARKAYVRNLEAELKAQIERNESARAILMEWRRTMPQSQSHMAKEAIERLDAYERWGRTGHEELQIHLMFNRSPFLVIPRVLFYGMSENWQLKLADLLTEIEEVYPSRPRVEYRVLGDKDKPLPEALTNIENPNRNIIKTWSQSK